MKTNTLVFFSLCILALLVSSCQAIATETSPAIDESEIQNQIATMQLESTQQAATIESLNTQIPPTTASPATESEVTPEIIDVPSYTGEVKVIEMDGIVLNLPLEVAQDIMVSTVAPDDPEECWPEFALPACRAINFSGYSIQDHFHTPVIYVYPVQKLMDSGQYGETMATNLQTLLDDPSKDLQMEVNLPFLPPFNAAQVFHVLEQRLDSEHSRGIRFLTLYSQSFVGVSNYEIFYTYQGLSADDRYYIAAILPINSTLLPDENLTQAELETISDDYVTYLTSMTDLIMGDNGASLAPTLASLDAMMMSLKSLD